MTSRRIRIVTFSTLFPSSARPGHGIFVEARLRELLSSGQVDARVIAPVPWFPSRAERFGEYASMAKTPMREQRNGLDVQHPRYLLPPKIGMTVAPFALAAGSIRALKRLRSEGFDFDLLDAHYYYPDGVAAALLARFFRRPFVVTARGTDINLIPRYAVPRRLIQWAASRAAASIAVCRSLRDALEEIGADGARLHVLRNGVDLERFHPVDRSEARATLGLDQKPTLLSVGYLIERKGHHLVIAALRELPDFQLVVVGDGPERNALAALAAESGVGPRVRFVGAVPQTQLKTYYSAADTLVLASSREGWANVLLESLACGTQVVATPVWGTPEVVAAPVAGRLTKNRSAEAIVDAVRDLFSSSCPREEVRRYAEQFSWEETTRGQIEIFRSILEAQADLKSRPAHV